MTLQDQRARRLRGPLAGAVLLAVSIIALAMAPGVGAESLTPAGQQYGDSVKNVQELAAGGSGSTSPGAGADSVGSLPFTGLDLIVVIAVAIAMVGAGFVLRRAALQLKSER